MMMSGRARPQAPISLNVEAIGIGKGETLPPPTLQPAPLYPSLEFKAVPLHAGEEAEYMLALKQELRGAMRSLPYYVKPAAPKKDIERYSDKYQSSGPTDNTIEWNPGGLATVTTGTEDPNSKASQRQDSSRRPEDKTQDKRGERRNHQKTGDFGKEGGSAQLRRGGRTGERGRRKGKRRGV
ncbi:RNA polymerase III subunit GL b isoform X2 [Carcharodon carcharias]|uniref:RNA polymerase III subunit GL b isoform X2 n=1 Tax=Carcharodon carcharias TaxID=13397 RepID=UPI001B7DE58B|nr:RNA polymerase III subunit GL b isoform X2 [Carcharodon carcharias]